MLSMESDAAAALRAEVENELMNKKQCCYQSYECTQLSVDGYKYCLKHILQDKCAPFKQCQYVYSSNGKRCYLPAPRTDKKDYGYCNEHALKATLARNKQNVKYPPPHTAEVLLNQLSHYIKKPRYRTTSSSAQYSEDDRASADDVSDIKVTKYQDVFADLDASQIYNEQCTEVLDFCSDSESDVEPSTLTTIWHDAQADSSDDESIDSESEDLLKHANVYTAEEICMISRDKLVRLQSLYVEQYRHLQYLLKERRRKYLHALKREKETCCNIYNQVRDNPKEQRLYKKLKALNNYHRLHGVDAILSKRLIDLRSKLVDGTVTKQQSTAKCLFTEGGVKCGEKPLPLTRHCKKHILEDANQVLFRACGKVNGDIECTTPVAAIFEDSTCPLHKDVPPLRSYSQVRKDSESDMDESGEAHMQYHSQFSENIKTEFMNYDIPPDIPKMETLPSMLFEESSQSIISDTNSQLNVTTNAPENNSQVDVTSDVPFDDSKDVDLEKVDSDGQTQEAEEKIDVMETNEENGEKREEPLEVMKCKEDDNTPEDEDDSQELPKTEDSVVEAEQQHEESEMEKLDIHVEKDATEEPKDDVEDAAEKQIEEGKEEMEVQMDEPEQALHEGMEVPAEPGEQKEGNNIASGIEEPGKEDEKEENESCTQVDSEMKPDEMTCTQVDSEMKPDGMTLEDTN
ncbi:unnamed protein product [Acanthoscelides obtectus]|uniref:KAT8 regulatory NSL complex subunit 2 n=1 Tax=Acanthoscelides obtectus TaxID=200917 RepID=A0A9P0LTS4_ACAOB|nr:unnamed protein product [Acanthoscelides obtectus]CAK1671433.1 KAT8 regulatory NSL complex subunit 2 [Acanthoscelides obtectus]